MTQLVADFGSALGDTAQLDRRHPQERDLRSIERRIS